MVAIASSHNSAARTSRPDIALTSVCLLHLSKTTRDEHILKLIGYIFDVMVLQSNASSEPEIAK